MILFQQQKVFHLVLLKLEEVRDAVVVTCCHEEFVVTLREVEFAVLLDDGLQAFSHELLGLDKHLWHQFDVVVTLFDIDKLMQL